MSTADDPLASVAEALFHPMGVKGVYARTALYVRVLEQLENYITRQRDPRAEVMRFPPVMSRQQLEKSGYLKSFPNLLGCVCALHGTEASIRSAAERHETGGDRLAARDPRISRAMDGQSAGACGRARAAAHDRGGE
jgi:hypothetical protein